MSNHTPGPWSAVRNHTSAAVTTVDGSTMYPTIALINTTTTAADANARLIAAAPNMKGLLLRAADQLQDYRAEVDGDYNDTIAMEIYALLKEIDNE